MLAPRRIPRRALVEGGLVKHSRKITPTTCRCGWTSPEVDEATCTRIPGGGHSFEQVPGTGLPC
jgi:hypothetical protein